MDDIKLKMENNGRAAFVIENGGERLAEMEFAIRDGDLTVFHTEVSDTLRGQGIGSKLLARMVSYAREHQLKVIPLCPFVHAQFKGDQQYADVWKKDVKKNLKSDL